MNNRPLMLSATFVKNVNIPGRYGDGRDGLGLGLLVRPALRGGLNKSWTQSVRIDDRPTSLGLGRYPVVTLAMARERALDNARTIAQGRDPRRSTKAMPTFAQALETVVAIHAPGWKDRAGSVRQWRSSLARYALPRIGAKSVDAVTPADVINVLLPIWSTKRVTASHVRQRIGAVMKWAIAQGLRDDNPAGEAIAAALPKTAAVQRRQRALPHAEVRAALDRIRNCDTYRGVRLAFEFLMLTAGRSGEVRNAPWQEIDHRAPSTGRRCAASAAGCPRCSSPAAVQCGGCGVPSGSDREPLRHDCSSQLTPYRGTVCFSVRAIRHGRETLPRVATMPRATTVRIFPACCQVVHERIGTFAEAVCRLGYAPAAAESATWRTVPCAVHPPARRDTIAAWHVGARRLRVRAGLPQQTPEVAPWRIRLPGLRVSPIATAALRSTPNCSGAPRTCPGLPGRPGNAVWDGANARRTVHASSARNYSYFAKRPWPHRVRAAFGAPSLPDCRHAGQHPLSTTIRPATVP